MENVKNETVAEATEPKQTKKRTTKKVVAETATTEEVKQPAKPKTPRKKKEVPDATVVLKPLTPKERAFEELKELGKKITLFEHFINNSSQVATMPRKQVSLLLKQLKYMRKYYSVLNKRLSIWQD